MRKKLRVGIIFGGRSAEHEVSLMSARNVYEAIDKDLYVPYLIGIDKKGLWHLGPYARMMLDGKPEQLPSGHTTQELATLLPESTDMQHVDVFFPILHGPYGEDGTVQGLLKLLGKPFVGSEVLGSAVGMDKDVMKRLLEHAGLPVVKWLAVKQIDKEKYTFAQVREKLGPVIFVKPANLGSSVGVHKVRTIQEYKQAVEEAFLYDSKILLEQGIEAREIECAVLGNDRAESSIPGEIIPSHDFYSYEAKYLDEQGARIVIPAQLSQEKTKDIQGLAIQTFQTLCVEGLARVDFFVEKMTEKVYVNEINTMPGFTNISMYPKLWEASGLSYTQLITRLLELASTRFDREMSLKNIR